MTIKNFAIISSLHLTFTNGMTALTGETGAGKSILIGSVNLALGQKMSREMIREGADYAYVELVFQVNPDTEEKLKALEVFPEDGQVIISRRLTENRSISKINGETCTISGIRKISELLLDIHGQHEHQSLLYADKQMEILDAYGQVEIEKEKQKVKELYKEYRAVQQELESYQLDEEQRRREINFLEYEIQEIEDAQLKDREDEELSVSYRKLLNGKKITENLGEIYCLTGYEEGSAGQISRALQKLSQIASFDENLNGLLASLTDVDSLLNDFNRETASYMAEFTFSEEEFFEIEKRLDIINGLKAKYGHTIPEILEYKTEQEEKLEKLLNFEARKEKLEQQWKERKEELSKASAVLTKVRKKWAKQLQEQIILGLQDLNFLNVSFEISFKERENFTASGKDTIHFLISTNPGEPVKELSKVVSGGELSRIMLAIKTLLADKDCTETLIFDEIDTGISGRTAQKVAEKMAVIGEKHQVLCITHLPQIASQAASHYAIEKQVKNGETVTEIFKLTEEQSVEELARMLGGAEITKAVLQNAKEMKDLAQQQKNTRVK